MRRLLASALFLLVAMAPASAMTFSLATLRDGTCDADCARVIVASGEIGLDSDQVFFDFVRSDVLGRPVKSIVLMSSPGGNLVGSLKLGIVMRQLGFSIMVGQISGGSLATARCYSACAYTLAGGRQRIVPEGSEVGVHRAWTRRSGQRDPGGGGSIDAQVSTEGYSPVLARYLRMMGVSGELVALADATPSSSIHVLSRAELSKLRMVTAREPAKGKQRRRG